MSEPLGNQSPETDWDWDPVYVNSRREASGIFVFWVVALLWVLPFCYLTGYDRPGHIVSDNPPLLLGVPRWLLLGVAVPWLLSITASVWFCFRVMKDDPLEAYSDQQELDESQQNRKDDD